MGKANEQGQISNKQNLNQKVVKKARIMLDTNDQTKSELKQINGVSQFVNPSGAKVGMN